VGIFLKYKNLLDQLDEIYSGIENISGKKTFLLSDQFLVDVAKPADNFKSVILPHFSNVSDLEKSMPPEIKKAQISINEMQQILKTVYGLSKREAIMALYLTGGKSIKKTSITMSISYETGRTMIKRIFKKTQTRKQVDLIKLILSIPT